jgi:uncharacterized protein YbjT (DUF2867 family)
MERKLIVVVAHGDSGTGRLVMRYAGRRGHRVRRLPEVAEPAAVAGADAIVLVPLAGDAERHAHGAAQAVVAAARRHARRAHLLLVSSFGVGYGPAHPFNRAVGLLPGMAAAEEALRDSGLPYTIVRPTWLTDDPRAAHALTFSQDPHTDGMLSRADLADALVAAIERPAARSTTFSLFNEPGGSARNWEREFARLIPDPDARAA